MDAAFRAILMLSSWLFLKSLARCYPKRELHLICDNYGTHKYPAVNQWLATHPRIRLHFTPSSASWLNLVERWFAIITGQAIRRGTFDSVRRLEAAIMNWLTHWNDNPKPFRWTKSAAHIKRSVRKRGTYLRYATLAIAGDPQAQRFCLY